MSKQYDVDPALAELFSAACDESLSEADHARLAAALDESEELRQAYMSYCRMHAALRQAGHARRSAKSAVDSALAKCPTPETQDDTPQSAPQPTKRTKSVLDRASRRPVPPAIAVSVVALAAVLFALAVTPVTRFLTDGNDKDDPAELAPQPGQEIATLTAWHRIDWKEGHYISGNAHRLRAGQVVAMNSGLAEITYDTGAKVVIEGPAEFVVGGQASGDQAARHQEGTNRRREPADVTHNGGYLQLGRLVARCDTPESEGFTIATPRARIEDLGTEFGVRIGEQGGVQIVVLDGDVEVFEGKPGEWSSRGVRLARGEGALLPAHDRSIKKIAAVDASVVASFVRQFEMRQDDASPQQSQVLYTDQTGRPGTHFEGIAGGLFTTSASPPPVTHLGFFDMDEDGLGKAHRVGIWDASTEKLLASVTVPAGKEARLAYGFRWVALAGPLRLKPSKKYMLAAEVFRNGVDEWPNHAGTIRWNPAFTDIQGVKNRPYDTAEDWPAMPTRSYGGQMTFGTANLAFVAPELSADETENTESSGESRPVDRE